MELSVKDISNLILALHARERLLEKRIDDTAMDGLERSPWDYEQLSWVRTMIKRLENEVGK